MRLCMAVDLPSLQPLPETGHATHGEGGEGHRCRSTVGSALLKGSIFPAVVRAVRKVVNSLGW